MSHLARFELNVNGDCIIGNSVDCTMEKEFIIVHTHIFLAQITNQTSWTFSSTRGESAPDERVWPIYKMTSIFMVHQYNMSCMFNSTRVESAGQRNIQQWLDGYFRATKYSAMPQFCTDIDWWPAIMHIQLGSSWICIRTRSLATIFNVPTTSNGCFSMMTKMSTSRAHSARLELNVQPTSVIVVVD